MKFKIKHELFLIIFYSIFILIGLNIYKDYGVGIEEHFQRQNGFYWLNQLLSISNFENFKSLVNLRYNAILVNNPNLPDPNFFNFYGIIFDLPLAFIETYFEIESSKSYFELRHLFTFLLFVLSSIFFYKILKKRVNNYLVIYSGLFFYLCSPRIFGDSFHNNKDLLFLSILTISISYLFDLFEKNNNKNLILFALFSSIATSSRIMGIYLPIFLLILYFLEFLSKKYSFKEFVIISFKLAIIFIFFLYLHYPYVWKLNIFEIQDWFQNFFYWMDLEVLFNGEYYSIKYLPRLYLPLWIIISTPLFILILFFTGSFIIGKKIFIRIITIDNKKINKTGNLWSSVNEKKDLLIFLSFLSFLSYAIFQNVAMLSGWRHFYFLHIYIIYISSIGCQYAYDFFIKKKSIKIFNFFIIIFCVLLIYENIKLHPFQSLYFSNFMKSETINKFQVDTPSLSRSDALKYIVNNEKNKKRIIYIGNASWTPMHNGKDMLVEPNKQKLKFIGQDFKQADYIYTNYIYKSDEKNNKNYRIPKNFNKIKELKKGNILIYRIYKRTK